jgi:4-carboxymuconolactone decarboxylase
MSILTQAERIAAEKRVRDQLSLPMLGSNTTGYVADETMQVEREIIGAQAYGFGEVWSRPGLDMETRCFITVSILASKYQLGPLADYVRASRYGSGSSPPIFSMR